MKRTERHHLKENEVAHWLLELQGQYEAHKQTIAYGAMAIAIVAAAVIGTMAWRSMATSRGAAMLAEAMTVAEAPVTAPVAGETGTLPKQPAGTFPSERMRFEAALPKFVAVADAYPSSDAGFVARYRAAATLVALGRADEGIAKYKEVVEKGKGVVQAMARLGIADAQLSAGKYADAVTSLKEIAAKGGDELPMDGVLMQLGRAHRLAGQAPDAKKSFQRLLDEFPTSVYAGEARREIDSL